MDYESSENGQWSVRWAVKLLSWYKNVTYMQYYNDTLKFLGLCINCIRVGKVTVGHCWNLVSAAYRYFWWSALRWWRLAWSAIQSKCFSSDAFLLDSCVESYVLSHQCISLRSQRQGFEEHWWLGTNYSSRLEFSWPVCLVCLKSCQLKLVGLTFSC